MRLTSIRTSLIALAGITNLLAPDASTSTRLNIQSSASKAQTVRPSQPRQSRSRARPTHRIGPRTTPRRRKRNHSYRLCCTHYAETFLSLSNSAEDRVYRWPTLSSPARSKFTLRFRVAAFRVIYRKREDAGFYLRCPLTIRCFVTSKRKH